MNFGFIASLVVALVGIVSVFAAIPVVSEYAFWVIVAAYVLLAGTRR
jgi:siderophore synthetase component